MSKKIILVCAVLCASIFSAAASGHVAPTPVVTAHRGGHIKGYIPENSIAGIESAKRFGYTAVECDPKLTSDGVIVLMHDKTINRTMRLKDGYRKIEQKVKVSDCTFEELRSRYVLASEDPAQRQPIPTLEEFALECRRVGMKIMLHSQLREADLMVQRILGDGWICFSNDLQLCLDMRSEGFKGLVLYSTEERDVEKVIADLNRIGAPAGLSTMDKKKPQDRQLTPQYIKALRQAGFSVQSSIFKSPYEVDSVHDGCDMVLSDFYWLPAAGKSPSVQWKGPRTLKAGAVAEKTFDPVAEHGAVVLELEFKGTLDVEVCGHKYSFDHKGFDSRLIGIRLYGKSPSVKITARGKVRFKKALAGVWEL